MPPQEIILSACSSEATAASSARPTYTPSIHLHDLLTSSPVHAFKTSVSALHSMSYIPTQDGIGGAILALQEGKAIVNIWAWQRDQMHSKLHLPEKLSCLSISPNGCWAAGGSPAGHIYLWELASGLLHASFTAHYRSITTLTFTADSRVLVSSSLDSAVHIFLVSRLVDSEEAIPRPYGSLTDHTLAIRAVTVSKSSGAHGGRCWTGSEDGTVKMWSIHPPFDLLCTFSLPASCVPTAIAVDPTERFFYVANAQVEVYHVPLFRRRREMGDGAGLGAEKGDIEPVGGGGLGAPPIKPDGSVLTTKSPITCLSLSLSTTHLLIGTQSGEIHFHSLPSHQHLRTITAHTGSITHLSTLLRPPDLVGSSVKPDEWPLVEIKPFERMRVGKSARDVQEVAIVIRPNVHDDLLEGIRPRRPKVVAAPSTDKQDLSDQLDETMAENKRLRASLEKAININERMWTGIVDQHLLEPQTLAKNDVNGVTP